MMGNIVTSKYLHKLSDGRIQCDLCPNACKLDENQRGLCFIRQRQKDQIVLTAYGRPSGFAIDPVEKKPLNHFLPGSRVLSFGTIGCNLACQFCQNWHISKAKTENDQSEIVAPESIAIMAKENGCQSVAFTYNEPIIFMEYAIDVAKACHQLGIKTIAVTNGYICDLPRKEFFSHMDAANVDLKAFTNEFYQKVTRSSLQPVLDTLVYLTKKTKVWLEITTLLIPDLNDSSQEIEKMCQWIVKNLGVDVPLHFSAFHPAFQMLDVPPTPIETLLRARDIAMKQGIRYVYTGNVYDPETSSTYCHHCHQCIIKRSGYTVETIHIKNGSCEFCNTPCAGRF